MKSHPVSVFQAIIKAVSSKPLAFSSLKNDDLPLFHIKDKKHSFKMNPLDSIQVDFFFFKQTKEEIISWRQNLVEYLSKPAYNETVEILTAGEVEDRDYASLAKEFNNLTGEGELCLEFLAPLPFNREKGKNRVYISKDKFIKLFEKRFSLLFGREITYECGTDDFSILPFYWHYTEIKHTARSQPGNVQYINGTVGKLYIKGTWRNFLPFLILGSEIHTGAKPANAQGYYRVLAEAPPYFADIFPDSRALITVTREVIETYDHAAEWLAQKEMYPFDEKAFAEKLTDEIKNNHYEPSPNTAFVIHQKNKKDRFVEQMNFKDLIVSRYLVKTVYKIFDTIFEEESIGSRKGISRERAVELIKTALAEGYEYMIESDIEDFFSSVDLQVLHRLLDVILPAGDTVIKKLLEKLTGNGYILEGRFHERLKGLALGNPLSSCLANLYLDSFDEYIKELDVRLIRYVDDFLIFCKSPGDAEKVLAETRSFLSELGLKIKMEKTILKNVREGFSFLGITFNNGAVANTSEEYEKLFKKPLYIVEPYVFMSISGEAVVLKKDQAVIDTIPLRRISEIMMMEKTVFSSSVIRYCTENRIPFTLTLNSGYYITTIKPDSKKYYEISYAHSLKFNSLSETEYLCIAKEFAAGKIRNYIVYLKQRYNKGDNAFLQELAESADHICQAGDIHQVRGVEGMAARNIFQELNDHIKFPCFYFKKRLRRQPDRINSLLNFGYYLLFSRINATVRGVGLNPYLGFLHSPGDNYESLVCDIQELFRARVDRFILRLINLEIIKENDFIESRNGFYLNKEGVAKFLNQFEREMNRKSSKNSLSLKEHIYIQVTIIKNWVLENKSLTFYKWDVSSETGEK